MSFDGVIHYPGDAAYESARVDGIFNARKPDRYPAAILEAASDADVVAGVRLAKEQGWKVSVRAGGHSWAAWSVHDDAIRIDLRRTINPSGVYGIEHLSYGLTSPIEFDSQHNVLAPTRPGLGYDIDWDLIHSAGQRII